MAARFCCCQCPSAGSSPIQQAAKVCVQALISADELVAEGEAGHEAALLEPENGTEAATEEDALHGSIRQQPLSEVGRAAAHCGEEAENSASANLCMLPHTASYMQWCPDTSNGVLTCKLRP